MKKRNLAFTVELMGLFILLVLVITVITQVFVMSRAHSLEARQLTEAVILAENAAEISSSEQDMDALTNRFAGQDGLLDLQGTVNTYVESEDKYTVTYAVPFRPGNDDYYIVRVARNVDRSHADSGVLANDEISVYAPVGSDADYEDVFITERSDEPVYTLSTSRFFSSSDISSSGEGE